MNFTDYKTLISYADGVTVSQTNLGAMLRDVATNAAEHEYQLKRRTQRGFTRKQCVRDTELRIVEWANETLEATVVGGFSPEHWRPEGAPLGGVTSTELICHRPEWVLVWAIVTELRRHAERGSA